MTISLVLELIQCQGMPMPKDDSQEARQVSHRGPFGWDIDQADPRLLEHVERLPHVSPSYGILEHREARRIDLVLRTIFD
jgi:hypothetical protein